MGGNTLEYGKAKRSDYRRTRTSNTGWMPNHVDRAEKSIALDIATAKQWCKGKRLMLFRPHGIKKAREALCFQYRRHPMGDDFGFKSLKEAQDFWRLEVPNV